MKVEDAAGVIHSPERLGYELYFPQKSSKLCLQFQNCPFDSWWYVPKKTSYNRNHQEGTSNYVMLCERGMESILAKQHQQVVFVQFRPPPPIVNKA
jgi:hypothetical protein